jgi:type VI secretion system protein ImpF
VPRADNEVRTQPSVLTRLVDDAPGDSEDRAPERLGGVRQLKQAVRRDLEALLNTRREALADLSPGFAALDASLLTYGLPDFTALDLASQQDRALVLRTLEQAIAAFEPRLDRVRIKLDEERGSRGLQFRIEAVLRVEPTPEPVRFDAELQLSTQQYNVRGSD